MPKVGTRSEDFLELVRQLDGVERTDSPSWSTFRVRGQTFGYLWERTQTVGLKQLLSEQLALVAERPEVFEVQFTAGHFGWVVVYLERIERDELAELTYEAWSLSAPAALVEGTAGRLPT
jgi:hypothetical protein